MGVLSWFGLGRMNSELVTVTTGDGGGVEKDIKQSKPEIFQENEARIEENRRREEKGVDSEENQKEQLR